jgi:NAD(P)-dependent dehydrogenase (short-subunit alcohol dehydrogenase family)
MAPRLALITGGTSGIGLATAQRLLDDGATVIITGRDPDRLAAAVAHLGGGTRVRPFVCDVSNVADLDALTDALRGHRLDIVFANAGTASFQPFAATTEAEFTRVVGVNLKGVFFTIQKTLELLADGAAIVLTASWTPHTGVPGTALYSATKAALIALARTLAADLAPRRIRVNSISPGHTQTPSYQANVSPKAQAAAAASGHLVTPTDIAAAVAFLASAPHINGQDLLVDGGLTTVLPDQLL